MNTTQTREEALAAAKRQMQEYLERRGVATSMVAESSRKRSRETEDSDGESEYVDEGSDGEEEMSRGACWNCTRMGLDCEWPK